MNAETYSPRIHSWIPARGHALCHAGIHFDAVRIRGKLAERIASEMMCCTDFNAGPIVMEAAGERSVYFLLPPQTASSFKWPPAIRTLTRGDQSLAYVGVPALTGVTWPLGWRSVPTADVPFVDGELLREVVGRVSGVRR
ncbi:hypothetical protein [Streptomyces sp. PSKA30]|uniref:hypothetical protein n=1 Tax=Streptomyces sp. PSKA30 TaxID=2874597 RepID=UPI001CD0D6DA|nr:hypothetical protein [Streptomyces sp. PSKA30]MBZ9638757.1 hypothetical protein [Streptomyces sp. PSKA30]